MEPGEKQSAAKPKSYLDVKYQEPKVGERRYAQWLASLSEADALVIAAGAIDQWGVYHIVPVGSKKLGSVLSGKIGTIRITRTVPKKGNGETKNLIASGTILLEGTDGAASSECECKFSAVTDVEYLGGIRRIAREYGGDRRSKVWMSFYEIYDTIPQERNIEIDSLNVGAVEKAVSEYPEAKEASFVFYCLLGGMVAENNKADMILGKKVKALGVHQALYSDMEIGEIARYSRRKKWRELDRECRKRGITTPNLPSS